MILADKIWSPLKRLLWLFLLISGITSCTADWKYHFQEGLIYGSTYHVVYEYKERKPLTRDIEQILTRINNSMSIYDSTSLISRINRNDPEALLDEDLKYVLQQGLEISTETGGSFDMTVAPLVNAWGFGFKKREEVTSELIDSLLEFTGYQLIRIEGDRLVKVDPRVMIDLNALVPGYVADLIGAFLESKGVQNYLVEIGGELRCRGLNPKGTLWRVGVDKPLEGLIDRQIQVVLNLGEISVTTSGNYRKFYEEGGVKYSHTIDPVSGYPARSTLLSATVLMRNCIDADAWATAFMVMGLDRAKEVVNARDDLEVYFIYSDEEGNFQTWESAGMGRYLQESMEEQQQPDPQP